MECVKVNNLIKKCEGIFINNLLDFEILIFLIMFFNFNKIFFDIDIILLS